MAAAPGQKACSGAPAVAVGAQQVGQQVGVRGIALGAMAAVARTAGLDGVGMDREDLVTSLDQRVDDQARGPLDGDAHAGTPARQAAHQLGQALPVVRNIEAIEHRAGRVDDAHGMGLSGPVQPDKDIVAHGQTPCSCGMTARVGRRGGKLMNRRSSLLGLALHLGARRGLPAPCGLRVSHGPCEGKRSWQSPQGHGSRSIPSVAVSSSVKWVDCDDQRVEHGLPTAAFGRFVASADRPPPWTTLRRSASTAVNSLKVAS